MRSAPFLALAAIGIVALCVGPVACDDETPEEKKDLPDCSADSLAQAQLIASAKFERSKGKPITESLHFNLGATGDVCIVVHTGTISPLGEVIEPPTPSMTVELDQSTRVASPSHFNAHPQMVAKMASGLAPGSHSIDVEVRGHGVARVSVFGVFADSDASWLPAIHVSRIEEPSHPTTRLKDEALLALAGNQPSTAVNELLSTLPFPALVVGRLEEVPIYRVYLPTAVGGTDLDARMEALESLPGVAGVSSNFIGGVSTTMMPLNGRDRNYVQNGAFVDAAWHLREIHADQAWAPSTVNTSAIVGVIDQGFNIEHPGITANLRNCWGPDHNADDAGNFIVSEGCQGADPGDWDPDFLNDPHGTSVVGLIGARGETVLGEDWTDTVGVVWNVQMDLARFNNEDIINDDQAAFDEFLETAIDNQQQLDDFRATSMYSILVVANKMAKGGVNVINMSFAAPVFDDDGHLQPPYDENDGVQKLSDHINQHRALWNVFLGSRSNLLVVQGAGNNGAFCGKVNNLFCSTAASGYACAADGLANRVLCVGASDQGNNVDNLTNTGGDLLAAPGVNVLAMEYGQIFLKAGNPMTGTSAAAPLVTGAAALLWGIDPSLTPEQLHEILLAGGKYSDGYDSKTYKILDLATAVQKARCRNGLVDSDPEVDACPVFSDIDGHWAENVIAKLACDCVLQGHPDGTFKPDSDINRAEALKVILMLALNGEVPSSPANNPYLDVNKNEWYAPYVAYAKDKGMLDFLNSNYFQPSAKIDRRTFVRLLVAAAKESDVGEFDLLFTAFEQGLSQAAAYSDAAEFDDYENPDDKCPAEFGLALADDKCFTRYINAASSRCVISGYQNNDFGPLDPLTRAQASKIGCLAYYGYGSVECGAPDQECIVVGP